MNAAIQSSSKLARVGAILAILIGTLLLNGFIVAYLWGTGVDFATQDIVLPAGSGFQINPLPASYKWLLGAVLVANMGALLYLLIRSKRYYVLSFAAGAAVPMSYLISILISV
ncbi:hypothetical protein [Hymenobacter negativus]|uniref:Uncharacterized protein n=1 Tax=Hymenobacter negativus TaxID=2795026 RepID=A0ABS3QHL2_9BACT|nr:hypothetical protein [Hymenobacter negativus]MBO2010478.1 hypothetical protein [Hymenobacter negativus]